MAGEFEIEVPYELVPGVYADAERVWHTRTDFTIDFLVRPAIQEAPDVARLVGRVKIPTMMLFELIRHLNTDMTNYEEEYGEIPRIEDHGTDST